jgi:hypothetical protein
MPRYGNYTLMLRYGNYTLKPRYGNYTFKPRYENKNVDIKCSVHDTSAGFTYRLYMLKLRASKFRGTPAKV